MVLASMHLDFSAVEVTFRRPVSICLEKVTAGPGSN